MFVIENYKNNVLWFITAMMQKYEKKIEFRLEHYIKRIQIIVNLLINYF